MSIFSSSYFTFYFIQLLQLFHVNQVAVLIRQNIKWLQVRQSSELMHPSQYCILEHWQCRQLMQNLQFISLPSKHWIRGLIKTKVHLWNGPTHQNFENLNIKFHFKQNTLMETLWKIDNLSSEFGGIKGAQLDMVWDPLSPMASDKSFMHTFVWVYIMWI